MAFTKFPKSIKKFLDQDYIEKLSDDEKEWLLSFNAYFYLGEAAQPDKEGQERKRLANRDIMSKRIHQTPKAKLKSPNRYYTAADYGQESAGFADALIDAIDNEESKKVISIFRGKE